MYQVAKASKEKLDCPYKSSVTAYTAVYPNRKILSSLDLPMCSATIALQEKLYPRNWMVVRQVPSYRILQGQFGFQTTYTRSWPILFAIQSKPMFPCVVEII